MASAPILNSVTLFVPAENSETWFQKGSARRMADGSIRWDFINTAMKRRFRLSWVNISTAKRNDIYNALVGMLDGSTGTYTSPEGVTYTVRLIEGDLSEWDLKTAAANQTNLYSGEITLEEV